MYVVWKMLIALNSIQKQIIQVIALMSSQINVEDKGGTMRLGSYPCKVTPGTKTYEAYGSELIHERHRHRFEFNNEFKQELTDAGLVIAGVCQIMDL